MAADTKILPVILSGGSGLRLWPVSRGAMPKQFQKILGQDRTLLQQALGRVDNPSIFAPPLIVGHEDHRFIIYENASSIGIDLSGILLEPEGRDTAAAVITAALWAQNSGYEFILALPSDHLIEDTAAFQKDVADALGIAENIVYFGVPPEYAHTGYGYIISNLAGDAQSFHEKPDTFSAQKLIRDGALWNSGIFLMRVARLISDMKSFDPSFVEQAETALSSGKKDLNFFRIDKTLYQSVPKKAFDKAYCEKAKSGKVIRAKFPWSDMGSWDAVHARSTKDKDNTHLHGNAVASNVTNSFISSDGIMLGVSGVDNAVVIATKDAVLVADKSRAQDIRHLVEKMKEAGKPQVDHYFIVHRPWGSYETLNETGTSRVIRMRINPKGKLSLQLHRKRSEHWIVTSGTLSVTKQGVTQDLECGQSGYAPPLVQHRLENRGAEIVEFIEVQTGVILDDDIERFDQVY